ncbi:hypothetical protein AVEN_5306-1 [Araneus ventricosus]|uniref:Uncharacterized protein n=1 Tax=Araneus ventricosus TaxID=182803 RepID=A0A4Y2CXL9_ARAVE|nr:hypothetical protein AVEN_5306-1 [Araneus ventricosus]
MDANSVFFYNRLHQDVLATIRTRMWFQYDGGACTFRWDGRGRPHLTASKINVPFLPGFYNYYYLRPYGESCVRDTRAAPRRPCRPTIRRGQFA